jgi:hypothetical protein
MKATKQAKNQNIIQHGLSVWSYTYKLLQGNTEGFRLPQWWDDYKDDIFKNLHDFKTIKHYNIWHDIGKPFCKFIDKDGKQHFPNHAQKSKEIWDEYFPNRRDISKLIAHDMDFHTLTFEAMLDQNLSIQDICTLMITALAELHSNANMFGGIESDSFKIKSKKWDKLSKKICEKYFSHPYMYILIRNDLSNAQKAVQACHAAIESSRRFTKPTDEHPSVILCTVKNENKLRKCAKELEDIGMDHVVFEEPDIGYQATALASKPLIGKDRKVFSRFQLLT